jgi:hypothetical protein
MPEHLPIARRRAIQKSSTLYVGLDVHKDSIDIVTAETACDGEIHHVGSIKGDLDALDKSLRRFVSRGHPLHIDYEAGHCGSVGCGRLGACPFANHPGGGKRRLATTSLSTKPGPVARPRNGGINKGP